MFHVKHFFVYLSVIVPTGLPAAHKNYGVPSNLKTKFAALHLRHKNSLKHFSAINYYISRKVNCKEFIIYLSGFIPRLKNNRHY